MKLVRRLEKGLKGVLRVEVFTIALENVKSYTGRYTKMYVRRKEKRRSDQPSTPRFPMHGGKQ